MENAQALPPLITAPLRRLRYRPLFADTKSWLLHSYLCLLYRLRGFPLPCRTGNFALRLKEMRQTLFFRGTTADIALIDEIFERHLYHEVFRMASPNTRNILDLGGNIGISVRLWQEYFPKAAITVVEPDAGNLAQLRRNVTSGPAPQNVRIIKAFAAAESGYAQLDRSSREELAYRMTPCVTTDTDAIPKMAIEDIIRLTVGPGDKIDLLKCDVEGAETEIFHDCKPWIRQIGAMVVETHYPYFPQNLLETLQTAGAKIVSHSVKDFPGRVTGASTGLVFIGFGDLG